jgi:hypothetical protein
LSHSCFNLHPGIYKLNNTGTTFTGEDGGLPVSSHFLINLLEVVKFMNYLVKSIFDRYRYRIKQQVDIKNVSCSFVFFFLGRFKAAFIAALPALVSITTGTV